MIYLRSLIFLIGQWLFTIVFVSITLPICLFLKPHARYRIISLWAKTMLRWLKLACGLSYRVIGREHIPNHPSVIMCKHQSTWETLALQEVFPPQVWVLKKELLKIPFFGWGLAMTSPIAIDRSAGREAIKQLIAQGKDRLAQGFFIVIFPEGTRTAPGEKGKYHIGGAWMACSQQATVVPVAHNAGEFWGKNSFLRKPGVITMSIGQPIETAGLKPDALNQHVEQWIENEMPLLRQK